MNQEHDDIRNRAAHYLHQAGFLPMNGASDEHVAMHREGVEATLALQYEPAKNLLRLAVSFSRDKPARGLFRGGHGELRVFIEPGQLLGLLCWITSSHDELLPHEVDAWLAQVVSLCPTTYAVLAKREGEEILALVTGIDPLAPMH